MGPSVFGKKRKEEQFKKKSGGQPLFFGNSLAF
jgi:hypothetical protein